MNVIKTVIGTALFFTYCMHSMEKKSHDDISANYSALRETKGTTQPVEQDASISLRCAIEQGDIAKIDALKSNDEHKRDTMMRLMLQHYLNEVKNGRRPEVYGTLCASKPSN